MRDPQVRRLLICVQMKVEEIHILHPCRICSEIRPFFKQKFKLNGMIFLVYS